MNLNYPPELPVCAHHDEILAALRAHPVVVVCGDTGSGKTTQLPKMALEALAQSSVFNLQSSVFNLQQSPRISNHQPLRDSRLVPEDSIRNCSFSTPLSDATTEGTPANQPTNRPTSFVTPRHSVTPSSTSNPQHPSPNTQSPTPNPHFPRIACTQPRRLAAVTMAERVAHELQTPIGGLVGYQHRFGRQLSRDTAIKFMTDGVLLAETRSDPLLRAYDVIIVDEAHERSLNVDFLLGILKRILARRRDLKVIVSSATLDVDRFSAFFDHAPVISVPGRLFPIELVYRPPREDDELDIPRDVASAIATLPPSDDVLVFLPGERDIRETADALSRLRANDDIIPLLASLPAAEQQRAFKPSSRRRIILATNVAETSVTIPGIRCVVDSGLARISRYVHRTQVQRLQIEPISQASARQRAGRCGRLGPGTCIRLYSEEDFNSRDAYTPPEVLRSSLAGVILTMLDLHLGDVSLFPFIDPPKPSMVNEGLRELLELGAICHRKVQSSALGSSPSSRISNHSTLRDTRLVSEDSIRNRPADQPTSRSTPRSSVIPSHSVTPSSTSNPQHPIPNIQNPIPNTRICLTDIGRKLAKIPIEPRLARMLLAAADNAVLPSALPIVAAMACDDPRRRPVDEREKATQAHAPFRVPGSDFLGTLKLWTWWRNTTNSLSQSKSRALAKKTYLSYPKMREWRDLVRQLTDLCKRIGISFAQPEAVEVQSSELGSSLSSRISNHSVLRDGRLGPEDSIRNRPADQPTSRSSNRTIEQSNNPNNRTITTDWSIRLHRSLLSGLLGRIGKYDPEEREYRGAHGLRFALHPSSVLMKKAKKDQPQIDTTIVNAHRPNTQHPTPNTPPWIMAGELVDTARLFARNAAVLDPSWLEPVAGPICKHSYHSPDWDEQSGFVRATEQVTLYGLVIVPARRCDFSRVNLPLAREIFIRRGLVDGDFPHPPPEVRQNNALLDALRRRAEKSRRPELFDVERLCAHFAAVLPPDVASAPALRKWLRSSPGTSPSSRSSTHSTPRDDRVAPEDSIRNRPADQPANRPTTRHPIPDTQHPTPNTFLLRKADWWPSEDLPDADFPDSIRIGGVKMSLTYRNTPDDPEEDGITCTVRWSDAPALRLWRADWLVPGALPEKLAYLISTLPSAQRRVLSPVNDTIAGLLAVLKPGSEPLLDAVRHAIYSEWGFRIAPETWENLKLPPHLRVRFRIREDNTGNILAVSRDLDEALALAKVPADSTPIYLPDPSSPSSRSFNRTSLRDAGLGSEASIRNRPADQPTNRPTSFCHSVTPSSTSNTRHPTPNTQSPWAFGTIPEKTADAKAGWKLEHFPALHDDGEKGVSLRLYPDAKTAAAAHAAGVTRVYLQVLDNSVRVPFRRKSLPLSAQFYLKSLDYDDARLSADLLAGATREAFVRNQPPVRDADAFTRRFQTNRGILVETQVEMTKIIATAYTAAARIEDRMQEVGTPAETAESIRSQLAWLLYRGFPRNVPLARLRHYARYLKGAEIRVERARTNPAGDFAKEARLAPYWQLYQDAVTGKAEVKFDPSALVEIRWLIEEYRVSLFAQELRTAEPVSPKRLDAKLADAVSI